MSDTNTITATAIVETQYGEIVELDSPYSAKDIIKALPWRTVSEEIDEHGSLRAKHESAGLEESAIDAAESFDFSDDFAAHALWKDDAWTIDRDAWTEAREFFEFAGYDVNVSNGVSL